MLLEHLPVVRAEGWLVLPIGLAFGVSIPSCAFESVDRRRLLEQRQAELADRPEAFDVLATAPQEAN
jgi:hypothetical protein